RRRVLQKSDFTFKCSLTKGEQYTKNTIKITMFSLFKKIKLPIIMVTGSFNPFYALTFYVPLCRKEKLRSMKYHELG
ncbi:hypothetical protein MYX76_16815, partial [Desulfobacterota bacterium AH_259_B03_O07]|nr:hypothetical protein [Desulfobacterota bacterium AH_259_B03_O07]